MKKSKMVEKLIDGGYKCERLGCEEIFEAEEEAKSHEANRIPHIIACPTSELVPSLHRGRSYPEGFVVAMRMLDHRIKPLLGNIYPTEAEAQVEQLNMIELAKHGDLIRHRSEIPLR